ncbi:hypothetical protein OKHIL_65270 [Mycolicibacterium mageritense]|uniref:hypothetical protein n=1 Tax=Mycolicibacterium sp. TaxID=2320850 RepID=UPI0037CC8755
MKRFAVGLVAMTTAVLAALWLVTRPAPAPSAPVPTHLTADGVPDFAAYPVAAPERYRLNDEFPTQGFRTSTGFVCVTLQHRAMFALDCQGPFAGAPGGANHVHLFSYGPGNASLPIQFSHNDQVVSDFYDVDQDHLPVLPAGEVYGEGNTACVHTDEILLACRISDPVKGNGFIATATTTTTFGQR